LARFYGDFGKLTKGLKLHASLHSAQVTVIKQAIEAAAETVNNRAPASVPESSKEAKRKKRAQKRFKRRQAKKAIKAIHGDQTDEGSEDLYIPGDEDLEMDQVQD